MTLRFKLLIVFLTLTAVVLTIAVAASSWMGQISEKIGGLVETEFRQQEAVLELEINVHEGAEAVLTYISNFEPATKLQISDSRDDVERFLREFAARAPDNQERATINRLIGNIERFGALTRQIVDEVDLIRAELVNLNAGTFAFEELMDEDYERMFDPSAGQALGQLSAAKEMEINATAAFEAIRGYMSKPSAAARLRLDHAARDFKAFRAGFPYGPSPDAERAWLDSASTAFDEAVAIGRRLMSRSDTLQALLADFFSELRQIDEILDERIQPAVTQTANVLATDTRMDVSRAQTYLSLVVVASIGLAILLPIFAAQTILRPIGKLTQAAVAIGGGNLETRLPVRSSDELGTLAATINDMAADLRKTTVQRSYLEEILNSLAASVLVLNPKREIAMSNRAAQRMSGFSRNELAGMSADRVLKVTRTEDDRVAGNIGSASEQAAIVTRRGGQLRVLSTEATMHDDDGNVDLIVLSAIDNSRQAETLDKLARSNQELERFAHVASHDLQEPLRMVASFTQLLQERFEDKLDDEGKSYIAYAVDGAHRMQDLINDLLAYSRVKRSVRAFTRCNLNRVMEICSNVLEDRRAAIDAKITWERLPEVWGDSTLLESLLRNLVGNALKYHSDRAPRVEIGSARKGQTWEIAVKDNGIGIEPRFHSRIFQPFERLHSRAEYEGTGIGLAICRRIVEIHDGTLRVESALGHGSTFTIPIPQEAENVTGESRDRSHSFS